MKNFKDFLTEATGTVYLLSNHNGDPIETADDIGECVQIYANLKVAIKEVLLLIRDSLDFDISEEDEKKLLGAKDVGSFYDMIEEMIDDDDSEKLAEFVQIKEEKIRTSTAS